MQIFDNKQIHAINQGKVKQDILRGDLDSAFNNNVFNDNYLISSDPGIGKSYETAQILANKSGDEYILVEGSANMSAFTIELATAVYLAQGKPLTVVLDDCDMLFEDKNLNTAKKMFDDARALKYNKNFRALRGLCTDLQFAALESFSSEEQTGFSVPLNNVTFIILTNRKFPTINEVEKQEDGTTKEKRFTDLYAIRRRMQYQRIDMELTELWGYVANVVLNEKICEKFMPNITIDQKNQLLSWADKNWDKIAERNLSIVEKMTKDMVRYPDNYLDIWTANYL